MKKMITILFIIILSINSFPIITSALTVPEMEEILSSDKMQKYISDAMEAELAPALSVVISNGNDVTYYN